MKAYLIDPIRKLIVPIQHSGTPQSVADLFQDYQTERISLVKTQQLNNAGDYLTHNNEVPRAEDAAVCWHYYCASCEMPHCFMGAAIITGSIREDKDSLEDPMYSIRAYKEMVQWGYVEEKSSNRELPEGMAFVGTVDEFLEWLEGSEGKSIQ